MSTLSSINQSIYEQLKESILFHHYSPGQILSENELAKSFEVSRTPVHNAFMQLKAEGLVNVLPQKGTVVSLLDWDYIQQIIYMRVQVEISIFTDAAYSWNDDFEKQLLENLAAQKESVDSHHEFKDFFELSNQFHGLFFNFVGKQKLWDTILLTQYDYLRYRTLLYSIETKRNDSYKDHLNIFQLAKDKNISALHRAIVAHHPSDGVKYPLELKIYSDFFTK